MNRRWMVKLYRVLFRMHTRSITTFLRAADGRRTSVLICRAHGVQEVDCRTLSQMEVVR